MLVHLDVAATDARGRPVPNLRASDFELTVDGAPQPLDTVTLIDRSGAERGRALAIFLDEYQTSAADADRVRGALRRFVDANLRPDDHIIVMKPLDSLLAIPIATDLDQVRAAIESFSGRRGDYEPRNTFERDFMGRSPDAIDHLRRQVTVSALNALAVRLGALNDGRKSLLVVSGGFVDAPPMRGEEMLPTVESLVRTANRGTVAIYTLDPAADAAGSEVLRMLAADTDGRSVRNDDGVDAELTRVAADSTDYYLLTCRPAVAADGRFHPVQVRVKRAGVRARARKGFWATTPDEALRLARATAVATEPTIFERTPRHASPLISAWFGMTRAADGKTRVTLVWEPSRRVPGDRTRTPAPVALSVKAIAPDGSITYEGVVQPTGAVAETTDGAAKAVFDAAPGRLLLEMSITGANSKQLDVDTRDLAVRDFSQPVVIGTPQILRARTARAFRALAADLDAAPVAAREFSRAEHLLVRFAAYAPAGDPPLVSVRLVSRAGSALRTFNPAAVAGFPTLRQFDVPLAGFAPGDYTFELSIVAHAGSAKELVPFRVTG